MGSELHGILCGSPGGVEDATGYRTELAVVRVLVELEKNIVVGGEGFGHIDQYVGTRTQFGGAFGALDMAVSVTLDNAVGGDAFEKAPDLVLTISDGIGCQFLFLSW